MYTGIQRKNVIKPIKRSAREREKMATGGGTAMNRCILENLKRIMILLRSDIRNRRGRELVHLFRQAFQSQMSNGELCGEMMEMMPEWCSWLSCGERSEERL